MGTTILLGAIGAFGLQYWWAFLIIWLLWIIVAHRRTFLMGQIITILTSIFQLSAL